MRAAPQLPCAFSSRNRMSAATARATAVPQAAIVASGSPRPVLWQAAGTTLRTRAKLHAPRREHNGPRTRLSKWLAASGGSRAINARSRSLELVGPRVGRGACEPPVRPSPYTTSTRACAPQQRAHTHFGCPRRRRTPPPASGGPACRRTARPPAPCERWPAAARACARVREPLKHRHCCRQSEGAAGLRRCCAAARAHASSAHSLPRMGERRGAPCPPQPARAPQAAPPSLTATLAAASVV